MLDAMFTEALGVLGFKHFAVYRLVQLQVRRSELRMDSDGDGRRTAGMLGCPHAMVAMHASRTPCRRSS